MPRNARHPARGKRPKKRNQKRPRPNPTNGSTKRNPFAALIVTGVRSLVSALPGATFLSPLVDIFFTSIGLSSLAFSTSKTLTGLKGVSFYGLTGMTFISYANIMARVSSTARNTTKGARVWFDTPYNDARLMNLTITASPDSVIKNRSGRWAIAFVPFRDAKDQTEFMNSYQPRNLQVVQSIAGSVTGPADRPLHLKFRPKPADGFIYHYHSMATYFGAIVIAYSDEVRTSYHEFTAEDWSPNIGIKGTISLRQPQMSGGTIGFEDLTFSFPARPRASLYSEADKKWNVLVDKDFVCTEDGKNCSVAGVLWSDARVSEDMDSDFEKIALA